MQSKATTVKEYLDSLPADRKKVISELRKAILKNIPQGFKEEMSYGMIGYVVPHKLYSDGYHVNPKFPLPFINVASQKNHIAVYHMGLNAGKLRDWFEEKWKATSTKKPDIGGACIRFKKPEDVPVALIGELASKLTPQQWINIYEKYRKSK